MCTIRFFLISVLLLPGVSVAAVTVISDEGTTMSLSPYLKVFEKANGSASVTALQQTQGIISQNRLSQQPVSIDTGLFPVTSDLTVGPVRSQAIKFDALPRPFFVIGNDPTSIAWVKKNKGALQAHHAIGLATALKSHEDWEELQQAIGMPLIPVSLNDLDHFLPVDHYPFLISQGWIEQ